MMREPNATWWRSKRVCVTGGTGFLGRHVIRELLKAGATVRGFALPGDINLPSDERLAWARGDIRDRERVEAAMRDVHVVIHTAGSVAAWGPALRVMHEVHSAGTRNVMEASPANATIVHTSSIVAIGATKERRELDEDWPFNLETLKVDYVHAKREAERIALEYASRGRRVVVVNPGYLVGPEDTDGSVMGRLCSRFWRGRVPLSPPGGFNFVDVRDAAVGHLLAAEHGQSGRRYILGGENLTLLEFFGVLADVAHYRPRLFFTAPGCMEFAGALIAETRGAIIGREPYPAMQHVRVNQWYWYYRSRRASTELGFEPRPLRDTMQDAFNWFVATNPPKLRMYGRWRMRPAR